MSIGLVFRCPISIRMALSVELTRNGFRNDYAYTNTMLIANTVLYDLEVFIEDKIYAMQLKLRYGDYFVRGF